MEKLMNKITMDEYCLGILERLQRDIKDNEQIEINKVKKNNGVELHGLNIKKNDCNLSATLYLEKHYEDFLQNGNMEDSYRKVLATYNVIRTEKSIDMSFFTEYSQVKDKIFYKLVNYERNFELLLDAPFTKVFDLAMTYYALAGDGIDDGVIMIKNSHINHWGIDKGELDKVARKNTPVIFPAVVSSLDETVRSLMGKDDANEESKPVSVTLQDENGTFNKDNILEFRNGSVDKYGESGMHILTNKNKLFGAGCLIYPGALRAIYGELKESFYVLPSSVHEGATRFAA